MIRRQNNDRKVRYNCAPLVTIDSISSVEAAADLTTQNKERHLLVVKDQDITKPLGIITPIDFIGYLKEKLSRYDRNAKILESFKVGKDKK
jgi:hypothetical protein